MCALRSLSRLSRAHNFISPCCVGRRFESRTVTRPQDVTGTPVQVEVSQDPEEFKWVERLIPPQVVPLPPKHDIYPTPSGWVPPTAKWADNSYFVRRTRFHQYDIRLEITDGGTRRITCLKYVQGDIWKFEKDLREYLEKQTDKIIYTAVDEFTNKVRVRGEYMDEVCEFLKLKGF